MSTDQQPGSLAERSRLMYEPWLKYLDDHERAKIDALDEADRDYFWTMLAYEIEKMMTDAILYGMEDRIAVGIDGLEPPEESPTPFSDAEDAISAHGWFGRPLVGGK